MGIKNLTRLEMGIVLWLVAALTKVYIAEEDPGGRRSHNTKIIQFGRLSHARFGIRLFASGLRYFYLA